VTSIKLFDVLSEDAVYNLIGHCKECWDYTYPNSQALEEASYRALAPFFKNCQHLGAANTIVDVLIDSNALDIKGCKKLTHIGKTNESSNHIKNRFVEKILPDGSKIIFKIPNQIETMVKRPKRDVNNWSGDPKGLVELCLKDYNDFAWSTAKSAGCKNLYSLVVLYGESNGYRSIYVTLKEFSVPQIETAIQNSKKKYTGYDKNGNEVCLIKVISTGSINIHKFFDTSEGVLHTYPVKNGVPKFFNKSDLLIDGPITNIK
jgi:hypothetical protein